VGSRATGAEGAGGFLRRKKGDYGKFTGARVGTTGATIAGGVRSGIPKARRKRGRGKKKAWR